jgi:iron uptake system component EfeO
VIVPLAVLLTALAACGDDDGTGVRDTSGGGYASASASGSGSASGSASGSGSASASASASGSASGSGITVDSGAPTESDDPAIQEAVAQYTAYVQGQVEQILTDVEPFTDAVRAGDVEAAKAAFAPSRQAWERIEPIAGLVSDIDGAVDARVDDLESPHDPAWTGWHKLEYLLWETGDISDAGPIADQLDADLATLQDAVATLEIPPVVVASGAAELIEEVSAGKITGEEDRYSHTDLWDFAANVEGSEQAFEFLEPALEAADSELAGGIEESFADIEEQLAAYAEGDGYRSYEELTEDDKTQMQATLADLSEQLAQVAGVLGLG